MTCFDEEPERRFLFWHPESETLFESYDGSIQIFGEVEDVTDMPEWEERFKLQNSSPRPGCGNDGPC